MPEELGTRDVVEQLDTRLGNLEHGQRDLRVEMVTRFAQVDSRFDQLRGELERRFGRLNAMMVTVLLAVVFGFGGLWLK